MAQLAWQGVPHRLRPAVWLEAVGGQRRKKAAAAGGAKSYADYLGEAAAALTAQAKEIALDIPRTFGQRHVRFSPSAAAAGAHASLLPALERVVSAVVAANSRRGYWQGMNFLCGFLLLCLPSEEDAFWVALCIIDDVIPCL